jgi:hypothetical protein
VAQLACPCGCGLVLPDITAPSFELEFVTHWLHTCGLTVEDVQKQDRRPHMVQMRRELARYLRAHQWSLTAIGRLLDRDHTTVLHLLATPDSTRPSTWLHPWTPAT